MSILRSFMRTAAALVFAASATAQSAAPTVTIDSGRLSGSEAGGVARFLAIPYAAPPLGDLRWRAPQPAKAWTGVKPVTEMGPACRQWNSWMKGPQSEDCLTLNVWGPAKKEGAKPGKYPVLVWIHGGGFRVGTGNEWGADGGNSLVHKGVILVMINYRLGVFGFFAHPELSAESPEHVSGNQAILDQIAALQWVQRNIASFGGDPGNVTIAGCSAGGSSVATLMLSPLAKGLFHRAIAESGVTEGIPDKASAEKAGSDFTQGLGTIADLRKMEADTLIQRDWRPTTNLDATVLPEQPKTRFASHQQNAVPLLLGWNADEGVDIAPDMLGTKDFSAANYETLLKRMMGPQIPPEVLAAYPGKTDEEAKTSIQRLVTIGYGLPHFRWAVMQHDSGLNPAYLYYYVHSPAEPPKEFPCTYGCRAGHSAEMRFAYGHLWREPRDWNKDDLALQERMLGYWTNFAKTGDPNSDGLPKWTVFDGTPESVERLGSDSEVLQRGYFPDYRPYLKMGL